MLAILGFLIVIGAVLGGFLLEKGPLPVLMQLPELLIIGGAATGTMLVANPPRVLKGIFGGVLKVLGKSPFSKDNYLSTLKMLYELLNKSRRLGMLGIEPDIENPEESQLFQAYPNFLKNHHYRDFVCDTMRMALTGNVDVFDMDQMIERDIEVHHHGAMQPVNALSTTADSLPGLGIVAAVLGVVITMSALDGPPSEIGHKVAAALVGTFLGILMCYGFVGPMGASMSKLADEENAYFYVMRIVLISYLRGQPPVLAIEAGRRAIPAHVRPSFAEVEEAYRGATVSGGEVSEGSEADAAEAVEA